MELITLGGGCFWCTEAIFKRLKGVISVTPGYAGGEGKNPTYTQVSQGHTGFAEAVQIEFDPDIISFEHLLEVFWATHDPTTLNQQGADIGTQYRSVIFYRNEEQKKLAEVSKAKMEGSGEFNQHIVTEIKPFTGFYKAEEYHQNYYERNKNLNSYCSTTIDPKIKKLLDKFNKDIKEEYLMSSRAKRGDLPR